MDLELKGRRALVTGGTRGIGGAVTLALAAAGVQVAAVHRNPLTPEAAARFDDTARFDNAARLDDTARFDNTARPSSGAGDIMLIRGDVSRQRDAELIARQCFERFGGLDILVNNAGVIGHRLLGDLDLAEWRRILDTNLTGMYLVTRAAAEILGDGGSIINIGSAVATVGMAAGSHYTAAKAGVIGLSRSLARELGPRGIRVNTVTPGIIDTDQAAGLTAAQRAHYAGLAGLNRLGQADEVADVVLFLASDLARFVSGVTLNVDGGI
ncbi:MAG: SDR family NAD(P)-dependent oxidoreductase [Catenulispora sp.]